MRPKILSFVIGVFVICCFTSLTPAGSAQTLAKYRDFEFGMSVAAVVKQTELDPGSPKTVQTAPELVQTLLWNRRGYFSSATQTDPVRRIHFEFYKDQLFKIVATYGTREIAGMTTSDVIGAISKVYGAASTPEESVLISSTAGYEEREKVLGRWENEKYAYSLFRSSYGGEFGLVAVSKGLDHMAALSLREGERLEALAAPMRQIERDKKFADERQALEEKARRVNGPNFIP